ncbi:MAG: butyrate kinase, partial [Bacteroidota bacterium]
ADIARDLPGARAYIADPVVVDELDDVARLTGHPAFRRKSIFHALNQKAIARTHAQASGVAYESLNLIIAHLGGGISVGAHRKGRVIDVNNALDGEGPFTPERAGTLPAGSLAEYCFSEGADLKTVRQMLTGKGGMVAYLGHNNALKLEQMAREGDNRSALIQEAMGYQVCKEIGAMAVVLKGKVDAILITGGIAHNPDLTAYIRERVTFIAPVYIYPGEDEMKALALNGHMVLKGVLVPSIYSEAVFVNGIDWETMK